MTESWSRPDDPIAMILHPLGDMPLGLYNELAPVRRRSGDGVNVTYVDEVVLREHPAFGRICLPIAMLGHRLSTAEMPELAELLKRSDVHRTAIPPAQGKP